MFYALNNLFGVGTILEYNVRGLSLSSHFAETKSLLETLV